MIWYLGVNSDFADGLLNPCIRTDTLPADHVPNLAFDVLDRY